MKKWLNKDIFVLPGLRSAIGQIGGMFTEFKSYHLGRDLVSYYLSKFDINPEHIDGVIVGEIYTDPSHPSPARYIALENGVPNYSWALNVSNNCASGLEALIEAARQIISNEAEVVLVVGQESLTNLPVWFEGIRNNKQLATPSKMLKNFKSLDEIMAAGATLKDGSNVIFEDPHFDGTMATTAEIVSQRYNLSREDLDSYAHASFKNALNNWQSEQIDDYIWQRADLDQIDENIVKRIKFISDADSFSKAKPIFGDSPDDAKMFYSKYASAINLKFKPEKCLNTTALNSCPKSDGAGTLILASKTGLKRLKTIEPSLKLRSFSRKGVQPELMGLAMASSLLEACERADLSIDAINQFEIHEAFASTALASYQEIAKQTSFDLLPLLGQRLNPNGSSIAMGHPVGATGIRLTLNCQQVMNQNPDAKFVATSVCAGGGVGVSAIFDRV